MNLGIGANVMMIMDVIGVHVNPAVMIIINGLVLMGMRIANARDQAALAAIVIMRAAYVDVAKVIVGYATTDKRFALV